MPGLPAWLTVDALKRRIDKQLSTDDPLLEEILEGAFEQTQEPPPLGCGRLLVADPPLDEEGKDTGEPVTREIVITGRRVLIPDARAITAITSDGEPVTGYRTMSRDGVIVRVELPRDDERWRWYAREPLPHREPGKHHTIEVTGRFGFVTVPMVLREAIYVLAARAFYEREAQFADSVAVGEGATASTYYRQLPQRTRLAFESFALPDGIAGLS